MTLRKIISIVFAVEIDDAAISTLQTNVEHLDLRNLQIIKADATKPIFAKDSLAS